MHSLDQRAQPLPHALSLGWLAPSQHVPQREQLEPNVLGLDRFGSCRHCRLARLIPLRQLGARLGQQTVCPAAKERVERFDFQHALSYVGHSLPAVEPLAAQLDLS